MSRDELAKDLAYARTLAEEGRQAPLIGGAYLVLFGVLLATAYSLHWSLLAGVWPHASDFSVAAIWLGFGVLSVVGMTALRARVRRLPGGASVTNRVDRHLWRAVAISIGAVIFGTVLRAILTPAHDAPNAIMAAGFGLYGVALYVTAAISDQSWLRAFALLAWAASAAMWFFLDSPETYLLAACASVIVLLIPGCVMMAKEPKATV